MTAQQRTRSVIVEVVAKADCNQTVCQLTAARLLQQL